MGMWGDGGSAVGHLLPLFWTRTRAPLARGSAARVLMAKRAGRSRMTSADGAARANAAVVRMAKESLMVGVLVVE